MALKILIVGSGILGRHLSEKFNEIYRVDVWHRRHVEQFLSAGSCDRAEMVDGYDIVFNCAVDKTSLKKNMHSHSTILVNVMLPRLIADACLRSGAKLIHFSSDMAGVERWEGAYALEKSCADLALDGDHIVVLKGAFFGPSTADDGFFEYALRCLKGEDIVGFTNVLSQAVTVYNLMPLIGEIVVDPMAFGSSIGYGCKSQYTKFEFLSEVCKRSGCGNVFPASAIGLPGNESMRRLEPAGFDTFVDFEFNDVVDTFFRYSRVTS